MSSLREQFEAWFSEYDGLSKNSKLFARSKTEPDRYNSLGVQEYWDAYQAGHAATGWDEMLEACRNAALSMRLAIAITPMPIGIESSCRQSAEKCELAIKKAKGES